MIIRNSKTFNIGIVAGISFLMVLFAIFSPLFDGRNGLEYADDLFNRLSKGSSYFIPKVTKSAETMKNTPFTVSLKYDKAEDAALASTLLTASGASVTPASDVAIDAKGDLGVMLAAVIADSDAMYKNDGAAVSTRYGGADEKKVMKAWHGTLGKIEKSFKRERMVAEAKAVSEVTKKAVEPAYNFYKIDGKSVSEKAGTMTGLLIFYVAYTLWWGYAIFYLFDGIGLSMKKAAVKKEA